MSPFLTCLFVLYKSVCRILLIRCAPSFRTRRYFSHHSVRDNFLQNYPSFAGETVGTRIDRDNSFIMPLRQRGGYATECHAFSYLSSSSAFAFLAAVAARTLNMHIPLISTPLISFRLGVGVPPVSFRGNKVTVGI